MLCLLGWCYGAVKNIFEKHLKILKEIFSRIVRLKLISKKYSPLQKEREDKCEVRSFLGCTLPIGNSWRSLEKYLLHRFSLSTVSNVSSHSFTWRSNWERLSSFFVGKGRLTKLSTTKPYTRGRRGTHNVVVRLTETIGNAESPLEWWNLFF